MKNTTRIASLLAITLVILNSSFLILRAQTNYTWNGSASTSFTTAANWTPNGVPGNGDNITIVSTGNNPVLAATDTVNKLTITSGTLDLGGHILRVQHQLTVSGSSSTSLRATNGRIINRTNQGSSITSCKMDCILDIQAGALTMTTVRATDSVLVLINATSTWKNNVFEAYVAIDKSTGTFTSGSVQPDSFLVDLRLRILSTANNEFAYLAYSSNANYVGGDLYMENLHTTNSAANVWVGSSTDTTARLNVVGDVVLGNVGSSTSSMRFYGMKMVGGGTVRVGGTGFKNSLLSMERCHFLGTDTLHLAPRQSATVNITKCTLYGPLRIDSATVNLNTVKLLAGVLGNSTGGNGFNATSCSFYGQSRMNDGGLYISNYTYGPMRITAMNYSVITRYNHFTDSLYVTNKRTTGNTVLIGYLGADTLATSVFTNTTSLAISVNYSPYSRINGNLFLNATSTGGYTFGNNLRITGNVQLNTGAANVSFGSTTHTGGGLSIGTSGYTNSTLTFNGYKHSGSGTFDLTGIGGSTAVTFTNNCTVGGLLTATGLSGITLSGSVFNGGTTVSAGSLSVVNNRFYGTTALSKTGSTGNYNYGNGFHGPTTITQSSSTAGLYWSNSGRDTSFAALTLNCSGSQPLTIANAYDFIVMGDLTVNRTGSGALTLAASNLIGKVRFEGGANQVFSSTGSAAALAYKVVVNKSAGSLSLSSELEVNNDVTLTAGLVKTTGSNVLKLRDNATATSASDASHVEGKVLKVGNDAFTFPVGRNGAYRPIAISAPSSTSAEFRAEYFENNSDWVHSHGSKDGTLAQLSRNEYWNLDRLVSSNTVSVTLKWDTATSCTFDTLANLRVAAWDGTTWKDKGNGGTTGSVNVGMIVTNGASTTYGMYALGTKDSFDCRPGAGCSEAVELSTGDDCESGIQIKGDQMWFKMQADSVNLRFEFDNMANFEVDTAVIYEECVSGAVTTQYLKAGDRLIVKAYGVDIGEDYYLMLNGTTSATAITDVCKQPFFARGGLDGCSPNTDDIPAPEVEWRHISWAPVHERTGLPQTQYKSAEDWWYGHTNHYRNGVFNGYLCPGYSHFFNHYIDERDFTEPGCLVRRGEFDETDTYVSDYDDPEYTAGDLVELCKPQMTTLGLVSPNGQEMVWLWVGLDGELYSSIQVESPGGYISVGNSAATRHKDGSRVYYNPTATETPSFNYSDCDFPEEEQVDWGKRHGYAIRHAQDGSVVWEHTYGFEDFSPTGDGTTAYRKRVDLYDIIKRSNGNYLMVGYSETMFDPDKLLNESDNVAKSSVRPLIIEIDEDGMVLEKKLIDFNFDGGTGAYGSGIAFSIVPYMVGAVEHYVVSGKGNTSPILGDPLEQIGKGVAVVAMLDENLVQEWHRIIGDQFVGRYAGSYDVAVDGQGRIIVPVVQNATGALFGGNNDGDCGIYVFDGDGDNIGINGSEYYDLGPINSFDLKVGVTTTMDGGFAICSSKQLNGQPAGGGTWSSADSDGYVAKFNSNHQLEWETTFTDEEAVSPVFNIKNAECLYTITEAPDGGLVVAGNNTMGSPDPDLTDHNQGYGDDNYLVKLHGDCGSRQQYHHLAENESDHQIEIFENDVTWDQPMIIKGRVLVESGRTLTITSPPSGPPPVIQFANTATIGYPTDIVVEPGAKLIITNGARLTALECCNETWDGIYVMGTPDENPSLTLDGPQGVVELSNGATIEHAKVGVRGYGPNSPYSFSGGIVRATGYEGEGNRVTFRNCRKGVELMPYAAPNGQTSMSRFVDTDFICDAPMRGTAYYAGTRPQGTSEHVTIWKQRKVRFNGCTFSNEIDYTFNGGTGTFREHHRSKGIAAIDADVQVSTCTFEGLTNGIEVRRTTMSPTWLETVESSFTNVRQGILSESSIADQIRGNNFMIPGQSTYNEAWGVYLYGTTYATVTDVNHFGWYDQAPDMVNRGIINRGRKLVVGGYAGGLIKDNTFEHLFVGTQTEMSNPQLQILCNSYDTDTYLAWAINPQTHNLVLGPQGTGCLTNDYRAGNKFYNTTPDQGHILSWSQPFFDYYYPDNEPLENPITDFSVVTVDEHECHFEVPDESCAETETPDPGFSDAKRLAMDALIADLKEEQADIEAAQDDNGTETATLLSNLANGSYSNATLTADLLAASLLSDTVLQRACYRAPFFTDAQFTAIINHNSPVTWPVWQHVLTVLDKLDEEFSDSIKAAQLTDTLRTVKVVERELARASTQRVKAIMDYVQVFLDKDEVTDSTYLAIDYMLSLNDKEFYKIALGTSMSVDTIEWARELLDTLDIDNDEDQAFYDWHDLALTLAEDTLTWKEMDETQYDKVAELANGTSEMQIYAATVLSILGDSSITRWPEELPELPSERRGDEDEISYHQPTLALEQIAIYPNPFINGFTIQYELSYAAKELRFEIFDLTGRRIKDILIKNAQKGTKIIDLGPCSGIYMIRVTADGKLVESKKLICIEK